MKIEKFEIEINTLKTFFELYCKDKHEHQKINNITLIYNSHIYSLELNLCEDCYKTINYSFMKLQNCPHEIKPRCRKCPTPCYEKQEWKNIARIMKYAAIKLSLGKIKSKVLNIFN